MGQVRYDNIVKWVLIATVAIFAIVKLKNCNKPASDFTDEEIELLNRQKDSFDKVTKESSNLENIWSEKEKTRRNQWQAI